MIFMRNLRSMIPRVSVVALIFLGFFPGSILSAVVTLKSVELYTTHKWIARKPAVYFKCSGENETYLPDVKEVNVLYKFKGEESWQVNTSIVVVDARLRIAREERQQFDVTSTDILQHLQFKEEELLRSIASCKIEASVASAWISFIESTWRLQCNFTKQKVDLMNTELAKCVECFMNLASQILSAYENELSISIKLFKEYVQKLKDRPDDLSSSLSSEALRSAKNWKKLEEEYHDMEAKLVLSFKAVENIRQLRAQSEEFYRKDDQNVEKLLAELQKMKDEFDAIERPNLRPETPRSASWRPIMKFGFKETSTMEPIQQEPEPNDQLNQCKNDNQGSAVDCEKQLDSDDEELAALEAEFVYLIKDHAALQLKD